MKHTEGQTQLQNILSDLITRFGASRMDAEGGTAIESGQTIDLPVDNILVANGKIQSLDLTACTQGHHILSC